MKKTYILLLTTILLILTACDDNNHDNSNKENLVQKDLNNKTKAEKEAIEKENNTFVLSYNNDSNYSIYINNKNIEIDNLDKEIVVLNFFSSWCKPCKGQIPYISDLKKKYDNKIFVAGILVNDDISKENLETFISKFGINYFISNSSVNDNFAKIIVKKLNIDENFPIPLTVLFKNGRYYSHYEGAVPIEMLNHDIKNAMGEK
ncbi:Putative lipoprotein thiredoxin [hydrothermal vent metagenome]|uniref:Putative lipoprotein thiredoxin n=1 Tax=hydrothermal vent metagenome TaxID=652676 RepID=A0A1W1ECG2_9ZZZZ